MIPSILKWLVLAMLGQVANIVGYLLNPIVVLFHKDEVLPKWLSWFGQPDNTLKGDYGWRTEHWQFRYDLPTWLRNYVGRVGWLYRNNMQGFDDALGFTVSPVFSYNSIGHESVSNRPLVNGCVFRTLEQQDKTYWQLYFVFAWSEKFCLRGNFGWKMWAWPNGSARCSLVCSLQPFMGYEK